MKIFLVLCCVAVAVAKPQGYLYGLPKYSGDASLVGAGSGSSGLGFTSLSGAGSDTSFTSGSHFHQQQPRNYAPEVQKHIYVHVPPPEHEVLPAPRVVTYDRPTTHYKIIFIKAPSPPAYQAPVVPQPAQDQEKTVVYVLVKKPEPQPDVVVPTPAPTVPAKPEVYFIKYNTHKDGSDVRSQSLAAPTAVRNPVNNLSAQSSSGAFGSLATGAGFTGSHLTTAGASQLSHANLGGSASGGSHVSTPHAQYGVPL